MIHLGWGMIRHILSIFAICVSSQSTRRRHASKHNTLVYFPTPIHSLAFIFSLSPFFKVHQVKIYNGLGSLAVQLYFTVRFSEPFQARDVQGRQEHAVQLCSLLEQDTIESHNASNNTCMTHRHQKRGGKGRGEATSKLFKKINDLLCKGGLCVLFRLFSQYRVGVLRSDRLGEWEIE